MADLNRAGSRQYWVGSAGKSCLGTAAHLAFLKSSPLVDEVDCVILMVGADDYLGAALGIREATELPWLKQLACYQALVRQIARPAVQAILVDREGKQFTAAQSRLAFDLGEADTLELIREFESNLRKIVTWLRARNRRVIFVTQPALWEDVMLPLAGRQLRYARSEWEMVVSAEGVPKLDPAAAQTAMDRFNQSVVSLCRELQVEFVEAAPLINGRTDFLYDDIHLNDAGCAKLAACLAEYLLSTQSKE